MIDFAFSQISRYVQLETIFVVCSNCVCCKQLQYSIAFQCDLTINNDLQGKSKTKKQRPYTHMRLFMIAKQNRNLPECLMLWNEEYF